MLSQNIPKKVLADEVLNQECKELITKLPRDEGWPTLYQYEGFWYFARSLDGIISCQKHFQVQDSDVFLVAIPKSGTTWLKAIMFTLLNRKRYPVSANHHPLLTDNPHDLVPLLEHDLFSNIQVPDITSMPSPRLLSTHMPYVLSQGLLKNCSKWKLVYLCRNPKDNLVSLWHFANKLNPQELRSDSIQENFEKFCKGVAPMGPFWDHVLEYWKQSKENPDMFMFLKYEDMKEEPGLHVRRLAEFLECPFSAEEEESGMVEQIIKLCSFDNLSNLEVNKNGKRPTGLDKSAFFRRGEVGDWKNHLSSEMAEKLDQITHQKFLGSGLQI